MNTGAYLTLPCSKKKNKKKKTKRLNIKQFKRLWRDYNFRYLYKHANGGNGLKMTSEFVEKSTDPCQKHVGKCPEIFENCKKRFTIILQKILD